MESFFSRYKNALVLILVLFAQVIGVAMQVRRPLPQEHAQPDAGGVRLIRYWAISLVSPPERLVHWIGTSVSNIWANYLDLIHVRQQNKDLQSELRRLRIEQGSVAEDARQGQRLQQLLSFKEKYVYKTLPAQIIGTSGTDQSRILYIDKGAKDGVAVDMPVITPDGIVGRVREVFPHKSQILEITDPTSGAGVILATTRVRGILRGNAVGQPQVINIMPDDRIKAGEPVVTSGGDQIFPRGLAVGVVDSVQADPDHDPLVDVLIRPAANLSRLEEVLVITNMGDEVMPREKLDLIQSQAIANAEQLKASEVLAERLPSRIDPDAPKSEDDAADSDQAASADGGIGRPMRPPSALHPDRFTPNLTPAAMALTPGARAAAQSEGPGNATASTPKPRTSPTTASNGTADSTTVAPKKKAPELVPEDGSRPSTAVAERPSASSTGEDAIEAAPKRTPAAASENGEPTRTVAAPRPSTTTSDSNGQLRPSVANSHPATPSNSPAVTAVKPPAPKTTVVVDGPLPSAVRKTTQPGTATAPPSSAQHPASATTPRPQTTTPAQHPATTAAQRPITTTTTPAQHPTTTATPSTAPRPATTPAQRPATAPAQRKGPELVPDDGSRPPSTMRPNPPKPQTQPSPSQPAPQPQGGR